MHSQDRISVLPVTTSGMPGSFLLRVTSIATAILIIAQVSYGQCPPDAVDSTPPSCLTNQTVTIHLDPGVCELNTNIPQDLGPPAGPDNCDMAPTSSILTQPTFTNPFAIGPHEITYRVLDESFNFQFCTFTLIVEQAKPDNLKCTGSINHSLNPATCSGSLTLGDVFGDNEVSCEDDCTVRILDEYGLPIPNEFDLDDINKTYQYELCCGGVCCWGDVTIQYYGNPTFECINETVEIMSSCVELEFIDPPIVTSQCVTPQVNLISQIENLQSCASGLPTEIIRTYQIETSQGPINQICEQTITIIPIVFDSIVGPSKKVIGCFDDTDPSSTGVPEYCVTTTDMAGQTTMNCFPLVLDSGLPLNCSVFVSYEDSMFETDCGNMITRVWHVVQWTCSVEQHETFMQMIELTGPESPVLDCPASLSFTTNTVNCEAAVTLPAITATDDCSDDLSYTISTPGGVVRDNGGVVVLPVGVYDIVYRVSDCSNMSQCTVEVTVSDMTPPVAICESSLKIGFGQVGGTFLQAYKLDGGSYDDCDSVTFLIARMDDTLNIEDHPFEDKILIECSDVDTSFMVILQVSDKGGNVSYCMVSVCVIDKNEGQIICPPMATVACDTIYDESNLSLFFGDYQITDNCPDRYDVQDVLLGNLNDCGVGSLRRRINLFNRNGDRVDFCIQRIKFEPLDTLSIEDIIAACPKPIAPIEMCDFPDLEEDIFIESAACQLLGFNMTLDTLSDEEVQAAGILSCMAVQRCWKFIDWCKEEGVFSKSQPFVKCDTVELIDAVRPIIIGLPTISEPICFFSSDCDDEANLSYSTVDVRADCSGIDSTSFTIFDENNILVHSGEGLTINVNVTAGTYTINWYAEDKCGNSRTATRIVTVENCKGPTLSCLAGLVVPLIPNSVGIPRAVVETKELVAVAFHACGYEVETSFTDVPFMSPQILNTMTFNCNDIGDPVEVEIYAIDENDRISHCTTLISVSDNGLCSSNFANDQFDVAGQISTSSGNMLSEVMVKMEGESFDFEMTNESGMYAFGSMPLGGDYLIEPVKTDDFLNGVSMLDLILIQQHVLGLKKLTDPYLLLAADVNQTGSVNIADLITLQRIILGTVDKPADDQSWMFLDADYTFLDATNPFDPFMPHTTFINNLSENKELNFIGVKYGDVDGNAITSFDDSEIRNDKFIALMFEDIFLEAGELYDIPFYVNENLDLRGVQFELNHSGIKIINMKSEFFALNNSLDLSENSSKVLLPVAHGKSLKAGNALFHIRAQSKYTGWLKDALTINHEKIQPLMILSSTMDMNRINLLSTKSKMTAQLEIVQIKPNPWSDYSSVEYYLQSENDVNILVTNLQGQRVYSQSIHQSAGLHKLEITIDILPHPGVYLIHIDNGNMTATKKMIKLE